MRRRTLVTLAGSLALLLGASSATSAAFAASSDGSGDGAYSATKTLTREFTDGDTTDAVDSQRVTVKVDHTVGLQGRERLRVSWAGAHPSGGRSSNPFGEGGLLQEYPVVIMQCRGLDDPKLPAAQQLSPSKCWTSTRMQRSQSVSPSRAVWLHDKFASEADRQPKSGMQPFPATECNDVSIFATHVTPFVAANRKVYKSCTAETMAPEASVDASFPPAEQAAFTDRDGSGETDFEVRSTVENESLGCSHEVACSLVVIPIMGISCLDGNRECRKTGSFEPGSSNFTNEGVDAAVSPLYWWSASNWRNRFSIPLKFALPAGVCDVLDSRAPTAFYGSELLSQAALQWAPAYCLRKDRFKWQQNNLPDEAAFSLMESGQAAAAEVSGKRDETGTDPVGYAPTAVSGFAVSYVVDKPDNAGEATHLRLNARLLAKLLTQSYPASARGKGHPGLGENPLSINKDPEFIKLNPGLSQIDSEAAATVMSLSTSSDVIRTLTSYISEDPDAMGFVNGHVDPWGMRVNPSYKSLKLPVDQWPALDTYVPPTNLDCYKANPMPYLPSVAAPVNNLRAIADAVLDSRPLVATKCDRATTSDPYKLGRVDRQGRGSRFLLGITTLGDAARFGLRTASLQAAPGHYVAPDQAGLTGATTLAKQPERLQPFSIDQAQVRKSSGAYPGTMVVYTAARLSGAPKADAAKVASFIDISSSEGQVRGRGNGQLPAGYLPIRNSGSTRALYQSAREVAAAVRAQRAPKTSGTKASGGPGSAAGSAGGAAGTTSGSGASAPGSGAVDSSGAPLSAGSAKTSPISAKSVTAASAAPSARTALVSSGIGGWLLPLLLGLGVTGLVASGVSRVVLRGRGTR